MSKLVKSTEDNNKQSENIYDISVTKFVLKEPESFKDVKDVQFENIYLILVTLVVSNFDKSKFFIFEQNSNIYSISITLETPNFDNSIVVNDLQPPNK